MSAPIATGAEGFLARYAGLREHLPGDRAVRDAAAEAFRRMGFPTRRDEAWKYTDLRPVAAAGFQEALTLVTASEPLLARAPDLAAARLVFVDGRYRADLSASSGKARFARFAEDPRFGDLARADREPMVALNTMLAEDGARIDVTNDIDAGLLQLISLASHHPGSTDFHPRHIVHLAPGARLTLLETALGEGAYLHAPVMEIRVSPGAALTHIRLQNESEAAFHLATVYVEVAESGTYDSFVLNLGGRMARYEFHARLIGSHAVAHFHGAQLLAGTQHADFTSVVRHEAPHGTSRQGVKSVLAGRSRGVFQGRIEVARQAQKTDGYQMSQALLLSPDAEIDTKPELEIFADDVKCSHGATVGELDPEQMFYIRSRGIPEAEARVMLVRAFLDEALEAVAHEKIRNALETAIGEWWERHNP
jgi:Fe-S cluster assembly protein SufD